MYDLGLALEDAGETARALACSSNCRRLPASTATSPIEWTGSHECRPEADLSIFSRILFAAYFLEAGFVLIVAPWKTAFWDRNFFVERLPVFESRSRACSCGARSRESAASPPLPGWRNSPVSSWQEARRTLIIRLISSGDGLTAARVDSRGRSVGRRPVHDPRAHRACSIAVDDGARGDRAPTTAVELASRCVASCQRPIGHCLAAVAAGVHLRADSFAATRVRTFAPAGFIVGRSVHGPREAAAVTREGGCDYLIFGTVFPSANKPPGHIAAGIPVLRECVAQQRCRWSQSAALH